MKKTFVVMSVVAGLVLAGFAGAAIARTNAASWPSKCIKSSSVGKAIICSDAHANDLNKRLNALQNELATIEACTRNLLPIDRFGGYGYDSNGDGSIDTTTSALDATDPQQDPDALYVVLADPSCVTTAKSPFRVSRSLPAHRRG